MFGNHLLFEQWLFLQTITWLFHGEPDFANLSKFGDGTTSLRKLPRHFTKTLATLCRWHIRDHQQDRTGQYFFAHINSINNHIKFTKEECSDNQLAFLDCKIKISESHKLTTAVYRKPTHTDHYLQFGSHHPLVHKLGVIRTLHYRAQAVVVINKKIRVHFVYTAANLNWQYSKYANVAHVNSSL